MVTIMVSMEIEPVAMEFMAVTQETKVVGQRLQFYEEYKYNFALYPKLDSSFTLE